MVVLEMARPDSEFIRIYNREIFKYGKIAIVS